MKYCTKAKDDSRLMSQGAEAWNFNNINALTRLSRHVLFVSIKILYIFDNIDCLSRNRLRESTFEAKYNFLKQKSVKNVRTEAVEKIKLKIVFILNNKIWATSLTIFSSILKFL